MPPQSWQNQILFKDWSNAVYKDSEGEVIVNIFPAQTLGKAPQGYNNVATGGVDIAWTVQGYTTGRFPLSHIIELPGMFERAEVGSCAFQRLYDSGLLDDEYADTHVLYVHTHGPGHIFTRDKAVRRLSDLESLKLRRPTVIVGKLLSKLGVEPVGIPAPQIFEQVQRGVIDGYMLPWEAVESFRLGSVTKNQKEYGLYALGFVATMNKQRYEALSSKAKAAIDANSGMKWSLIAGRGYDEADQRARSNLESQISRYSLSPEDQPHWQAAADQITKEYLEELESNGYPSNQIYRMAKQYISACQAEL